MSIPDRMVLLQRYGGFPVPFTVLVDLVTGIPDFTATDMERWYAAVSERLCGVCGTPLDYWIWFIGGPQSMEIRSFFDPGMHEECARYALSVCPYLSGLKGYRPAPRQHEGAVIEVKHNVVDSPDICLGNTRDFVFDIPSKIITAAPFTSIETFSRKGGIP